MAAREDRNQPRETPHFAHHPWHRVSVRGVIMRHHPFSLRWLIGGIYFLIITTTLGALALYLSAWIEHNSMERMRQALIMQLRLGSDLMQRLVLTQDDARRYTGRIFVFGNALSEKAVRSVTLVTTDGTIIAETPLHSNGTATITPTPEMRAVSIRNSEASDIRANPLTGEMTLYVARYIRFGVKADHSGTPPAGVRITVPPQADTPTGTGRSQTRLVKDGVLVLAETTPCTLR
eukprot:TRINITY_DN17565_c0_g1_i1.p1 TRINITY_DN17565_c0_g1~~TRINITY_DN17565_c0_g1_i1.p1  ORF type:complete len:234 (-),score=-6.09 TRINITY_DN17565_c0_g1_i1:5-706(-)